jgi:hypothetical protein
MAWQGKSVGQICEHADVTSDAGSSAGDIEAARTPFPRSAEVRYAPPLRRHAARFSRAVFLELVVPTEMGADHASGRLWRRCFGFIWQPRAPTSPACSSISSL